MGMMNRHAVENGKKKGRRKAERDREREARTLRRRAERDRRRAEVVPFGKLEQKASKAAARAGLSLFARRGEAPRWLFSDRATGRLLLTYFPKTREAAGASGDRGECRGWREAVEIAAARRGGSSQ